MGETNLLPNQLDIRRILETPRAREDPAQLDPSQGQGTSTRSPLTVQQEQGFSPIPSIPAPAPGSTPLAPPQVEEQILLRDIERRTGQTDMDIQLKVLQNRPLTPDELIQLEMMQDTPLVTGAQGIGTQIQALQATAQELPPFLIAGGSELAGTLAGGAMLGLGGATGGAMVGSVAGELINQSLGFTEISQGALAVAAFAPAAVDLSMDVVRTGGRRVAEVTAIGRANRGRINAQKLVPGAAERFLPELAREMQLQAGGLVRSRQQFKVLEDAAFNAVRNDATTIDLSEVGEAIRTLDPKTVSFMRRKMGALTTTREKFNQFIPPKPKKGQTLVIQPDANQFNGRQLVDFRQTLDEMKDEAFTKGGVRGNARGRELNIVKRQLDQVINDEVARLQQVGATGAAENLRRANRVSQWRAAVDEWTQLVAGAADTFPIRERNFIMRGGIPRVRATTAIVPEYNMNVINRAILNARTRIDQGLGGGRIDTLTRMIDESPGGRASWDAFMSAVTANSPSQNITVLQPGEGLMTRTLQGASRALGLSFLNEVIIHPVGRRILQDTFWFQGHTTVTRNMLSQIIGVMRTYENLEPPNQAEVRVRELSKFVVERLAAEGVVPAPRTPGVDVGAVTQLTPAQQTLARQRTTALGIEALDIPAGFTPERAPSPAGVFERELPESVRFPQFGSPRGSAL